jgi:hypothetical protein
METSHRTQKDYKDLNKSFSSHLRLLDWIIDLRSRG